MWQFSIQLSQVHQKGLILKQKVCLKGELHQKGLNLQQFEIICREGNLFDELKVET